jgi:hypothetical protein
MCETIIASGVSRPLRVVLTMTDDPAWESETRRIDANFLSDHLEGELGSFTYLVAGPPSGSL